MTKMNSFYFDEIAKIPLLTIDEEKALATKAISGNKMAQKKLIKANLRFVVKIANQYKEFMSLDDLINEGNMGLMHAVEKFNPDNGNKFSTYAVWWIKAYIKRSIIKSSTCISFPANKLEEMIQAKNNILSLDKTISKDNDETFGSLLADKQAENPEEKYFKKDACMRIQELVKSLKQKEQFVVIKRYGLDGKKPMSLSEIGTLIGYSKERIRQIEKHTLLKLRNTILNSDYYADLAA